MEWGYSLKTMKLASKLTLCWYLIRFDFLFYSTRRSFFLKVFCLGAILYSYITVNQQIPEDARSNAWVSFDGKRRQQLSRGDSVKICMSQHPLPTVNKFDQTGDWFQSLIRCLNWNERQEQRALWLEKSTVLLMYIIGTYCTSVHV